MHDLKTIPLKMVLKVTQEQIADHIGVQREALGV